MGEIRPRTRGLTKDQLGHACPVWLTEEEGVACDVSGGQVAAGAHNGDAASVAAVLDAASVGEGVAVGQQRCGVRGKHQKMGEIGAKKCGQEVSCSYLAIRTS